MEDRGASTLFFATLIKMQPDLPTRILHTKPIKIRKVAGNKDIVAGESDIPVNVFVVDCDTGDCSLTPNMDDTGKLLSFDLRGKVIGFCVSERLMSCFSVCL